MKFFIVCWRILKKSSIYVKSGVFYFFILFPILLRLLWCSPDIDIEDRIGGTIMLLPGGFVFILIMHVSTHIITEVKNKVTRLYKQESYQYDREKEISYEDKLREAKEFLRKHGIKDI